MKKKKQGKEVKHKDKTDNSHNIKVPILQTNVKVPIFKYFSEKVPISTIAP